MGMPKTQRRNSRSVSPTVATSASESMRAPPLAGARGYVGGVSAASQRERYRFFSMARNPFSDAAAIVKRPRTTSTLYR
jgi:hypothetical protein